MASEVSLDPMASANPPAPVRPSATPLSPTLFPLPDSSSVPTLNNLDANTWAERNPQKQVLAARSRAKPTDAQKASQKISAQRNKAARGLLSIDIITLVATRKQQLQELATKHNVTIQHIEKLVDNTSHYKKARAPNLANAIAHLKGKELNDGKQQ
jgi:hypothetical protein